MGYLGELGVCGRRELCTCNNKVAVSYRYDVYMSYEADILCFCKGAM